MWCYYLRRINPSFILVLVKKNVHIQTSKETIIESYKLLRKLKIKSLSHRCKTSKK